MKYRRLTYEELEERTPQFIQFLTQHSIDTSEWSQLLERNPQQALLLVEKFSDLVLEAQLSKIQFLEQRSQNELRIFKLLKTKIVEINLLVNDEAELNLFRHASIAKMLAKFDRKMWETVQLSIKERKYQQARSQEIFQLMQEDCFISKASEFNALYNMGRRMAA